MNKYWLQKVGLKMNINDLLSYVPALISALAGFITALAGILPLLSTPRKSRERRAIPSPESPPLQFVKMKQTPLDKENWKKFKKLCLSSAIIFVSFVAIIIGLTIYSFVGFIFFGTFSREISHIIIGSISAVIVIINFVIYTRLSYLSISWYIRAGKNPEEARYFLFQDIKMVAQSDYKDLLLRCKEVLTHFSLEGTEYDFDTGSLETHVSAGLKLFQGILNVKIEQIEKNGCFIQIKFIPHTFHEFAFFLSSSSWIVTQFVRQLEGK